jgi:hypothetical protein
MKRAKRPLPIPQYEFGFISETFNLFSETTADGERVARERAELEQARREADAAQASLLTAREPSPKLASPYRLRAGDVIRFENQPCTVLRVTDCAAVIAVTRPPREFTTLFGKRVRIQPKPALVRIASNSECSILKREGEIQ